jgi:hypothetical protein
MERGAQAYQDGGLETYRVFFAVASMRRFRVDEIPLPRYCEHSFESSIIRLPNHHLQLSPRDLASQHETLRITLRIRSRHIPTSHMPRRLDEPRKHARAPAPTLRLHPITPRSPSAQPFDPSHTNRTKCILHSRANREATRDGRDWGHAVFGVPDVG